jgi:NTE family protein
MGRALVLGGGGALARAWEIGLLSGLAAKGLDLVGTADIVIGTSAGAIVAACRLTGADYEDLYRNQLNGPAPSTGRMSLGLALHLGWLMIRHRDPARYRLAVGRFASTVTTMSATQRRDEIASRLPGDAWPLQRLVVTAVDALTGELVSLTRESGLSLIDAVTASTAAPGICPVVKASGRAFIDGGIASVTNVALAAGHDRIVVLAPFTRGNGPVRGVHDELAQVHRDNARLQAMVLAPDKLARRAIGYNPTDASRSADVVRAGRTQADAVASELDPIWNHR